MGPEFVSEPGNRLPFRQLLRLETGKAAVIVRALDQTDPVSKRHLRLRPIGHLRGIGGIEFRR